MKALFLHRRVCLHAAISRAVIIFSMMVVPSCVLAQRKATVTICPSSTETLSRLQLYIDNGQKTYSVKPIIRNDSAVVTSEYYGRYLTVSVAFPDASQKEGYPLHSFWVGDQPAIINFNTKDQRRYILTNAMDCDSLYYADYYRFIRKTLKEFEDYCFKYRDSLSIPQYDRVLQQKGVSAHKKSLEYFRDKGHLYSSLSMFKRDYASSDWLPANDLLTFFQTVFPDSLKQTYEGMEVLKRLNGRINTRKGGEAPLFEGKDIHGRTVTLQALRGKHVLLDFWASWCGPCRRLTPTLKKIREQYPTAQLEMLSLSIDGDKNAFQKAIEEDQPSWTQLVPDTNIEHSYAITVIPHILLLNPQGIVIYSKDEDNDRDLSKLEQQLHQLIHK